MDKTSLKRYRKAIGAAALTVAEVAVLWAGAPEWVTTAGAVAIVVAVWALPNAQVPRLDPDQEAATNA